MRGGDQSGVTATELLLLALLLVIVAAVGGILIYLFSNALKAQVTSVKTIDHPSQILYGESGIVTLQIDFSRKARAAQQVRVELYDSDSLGFNDDRLGAAVKRLNVDEDQLIVRIVVTCSSSGELNDDDDDSDHVYEVYGYVDNDGHGNQMTEENNNIIRCVETLEEVEAPAGAGDEEDGEGQ